MAADPEVQFGREICGDLVKGESREWLVTNGIGGYASGTVAGTNTRRYHGLLIAALQPPVGRTQLVASLDETVHYAGAEFCLATHRWASGVADPQGFCNIKSFQLEGMKPVWTFVIDNAVLEKRIWMRQGENTTYVQYSLLYGTGPVEMDLKALVNYRDYHSSTHAGNWQMKLDPFVNGVRILAFDGAAPFFLRSEGASCKIHGEWYRDCYFPEETLRGLDDREDHLFAAMFHAKLEVGASATFVLTTMENESLEVEASRIELANHETNLLRDWKLANEPFAKEASAASPG